MKDQKIVFSKTSYLPFTFISKACDYVYTFNEKLKGRICYTLLNINLDREIGGIIRPIKNNSFVSKDLANKLKEDILLYNIESREDIKIAIDSANSVDNKIFLLSFENYPIGIFDLIMAPSVKNSNVIYKFSSKSLLNTEYPTEYIYLSMRDNDKEVNDDYSFTTSERCLLLNIDNILNRFNLLRQNISVFKDVSDDFNIICRDDGQFLDIELAGINTDLAKKICKKIIESDLEITTKTIKNTVHIYLNLLPMTILGMDKIDATNIACFMFTVSELMVNRENSLKDNKLEEYNKYSKDLKVYIKDMRENLILPLKTKCKIKNFSFKKTA